MSRFEEISSNLFSVKGRISEALKRCGRDEEELTLIVVTKNFPSSDAEILYELGVREMGENRDEEGASKSLQLPSDIHWHFQGQVQSRKIRSISSWASTVHSLDSLSHAKKFEGIKERRTEDFFIQVNLEPQRVDRGGVSLEDLPEFLHQLTTETDVQPSGLMTVAPLSANPRDAFFTLREARDEVNVTYPSIRKLSMGMSGDFEEAILEGATHIRVGSSILGSRGYPA